MMSITIEHEAMHASLKSLRATMRGIFGDKIDRPDVQDAFQALETALAPPFDDPDDFSTTTPTVEGAARLVLTDALAVLRFFHLDDEPPLIKRIERLLGADA